MKAQRRSIAVTLLLVGLLVWIPRQRDLRSRQSRLESQSAESARLLEQAREERREAETLRADIAGECVAAQAARSRMNRKPESRESGEASSGPGVPPSHLPDWNAGSPYVWIPKSLMPALPVEPFGVSGELRPGLAAVLALKPEQQQRLNRMVSEAAKAARDAESASATLLSEPLPGLGEGPGDVVTLRVEGATETSLKLRSDLEAALTQELGEERSRLLQRWGEDWFDGRFGRAESEAKVFSVRSTPDGTFALVVKTGSHQFSVSGSDHFMGYIPSHLRHWFSALGSPDSVPPAEEP